MKKARNCFIIAATTVVSPFFAPVSHAQTSSWSLSGSSELPQSEFRALTPWRDGGLMSKSKTVQPMQQVSRRDFANALAQKIPVLAFARDWRDTLRGTGAQSKRSFKLLDGAADNDLVLLVGAQQLPSFSLANLHGGTTPGLGLTWGKLAFGTSSTRRAFDRVASSYDRLTEGTKDNGSTDLSTMTWMTLRPLESKSGTIDVLFMRANRDMTPWKTDDKEMIEGTSFGARTDLKLSRDWSLRGEWMNNQIEDGDATTAWKIDSNGSLDNPLGKMTFAFYMDSRDPNYAAIGDMRESEGYANNRVLVVQNLNWGDVGGSVRFAADSHENLSPDLRIGDEQKNENQETSADFKWKLSPRISAVAKYSSRDSEQDLKSLLEDENALGETSRVSTEAGFELKLNSSMSLTATASQIFTDRDFTSAATDAERHAIARLREKRLALGLSRRTKIGSWSVRVAQHDLKDSIGSLADSSAQSLQLQAERQLLPNLRLRGTWNLNTDDDFARSLSNERANQSLEAQWKVSSRSDLVLNYSNWDAEYARRDDFTRQGGDEMGVRFNYGGSRSGNGLGLSLEYSKRDTPNPDDNERYRIGLTFK